MELDSKDFDNKTKKEDKPLSTSVTGIKREHDSLDDFEHLDPELSPLKELPPGGFPGKQLESQSDIFRPTNTGIETKDLDLDPFSKKLEPSMQTLSETVHTTEDLLSEFLTKSSPKDESLVLGDEKSHSFESFQVNDHKLLESELKDSLFGDFKKEDAIADSKHDVMKFLEAETTSNNKTDKGSDLRLSSDDFDVKDVFADKSQKTVDETGKLLDNIEEHYDTLTKNIHDSLPSELKESVDTPMKFESEKKIHSISDSKSDLETEDFAHKFDPASSIGEFDHTHKESKDDSSSTIKEPEPVEDVKPSPIVEPKPVEEINPSPIVEPKPVKEIKPSPVVQNKAVEEVKPSSTVIDSKTTDEIKPFIEPVKQPETINPTELDEFLDTEQITNETEPIPETKPVPVVVPVKPVDRDVKPKEEKPVKVKTPSLDDIIGPEDVFKKFGLDTWFNPDRLHPKVEALIYWRDPKKSGVVFGGILAILLSLAYLSLISVVAYVSLFTLFGTIVFRVYKNILQAVQKTTEGHPFKEFLEYELSLPQDKVRELTDTAVTHINAAVVELRRLFLVEDLVDSMKFGVLLWCLTYIGALFNGLTLVILGFVALFTIPKVYENNKTTVDAYLDIARSKIADITIKVKTVLPIGKKEAEKEKDQ